jgi:predicted RNase H-like nuclease
VLAGVDGCRGGWAAAVESGSETRLIRVASLSELGAALAVIDIPIGLPVAGPRLCDVAARALLGRPRGSSVFPAPTRLLLADPSPRCSRQLFNILGKIREADALMTPQRQSTWVEGHPEVSFALMREGRGIAAPKRTAEGRSVRLDLLRRSFAGLPSSLDDDEVDAYALLWSARRFAAGMERRLPGRLEIDARGLRMEMVA